MWRLPKFSVWVGRCTVVVVGLVAVAYGGARLKHPMMPVDWLLSERFDTLSKVGRLDLPMMFLHGSADEAVPPGMTEQLYRLVKVEAAGHKLRCPDDDDDCAVPPAHPAGISNESICRISGTRLRSDSRAQHLRDVRGTWSNQQWYIKADQSPSVNRSSRRRSRLVGRPCSAVDGWIPVRRSATCAWRARRLASDSS